MFKISGRNSDPQSSLMKFLDHNKDSFKRLKGLHKGLGLFFCISLLRDTIALLFCMQRNLLLRRQRNFMNDTIQLSFIPSMLVSLQLRQAFRAVGGPNQTKLDKRRILKI